MDDTKDKLSAAGSSLRILKNLKAPEDETSLFMSSFDPTLSRTAKLQREKDKKKRKKKKEYTPNVGLYDKKGLLLSNGVDLCDCLDLEVCCCVVKILVFNLHTFIQVSWLPFRLSKVWLREVQL